MTFDLKPVLLCAAMTVAATPSIAQDNISIAPTGDIVIITVPDGPPVDDTFGQTLPTPTRGGGLMGNGLGAAAGAGLLLLLLGGMGSGGGS